MVWVLSCALHTVLQSESDLTVTPLANCNSQRGLVDKSEEAAAPDSGQQAAAVQLEMVRFTPVRCPPAALDVPDAAFQTLQKSLL